jgi:hypothetical protein
MSSAPDLGWARSPAVGTQFGFIRLGWLERAEPAILARQNMRLAGKTQIINICRQALEPAQAIHQRGSCAGCVLPCRLRIGRAAGGAAAGLAARR